MPIDINKHEVDIENLFKQNVNDLASIKELYKKLKELEKKISQIKYIDSNLADKLKKDYEKLKRIILDENIQLQLNNSINEINSQLEHKAKKTYIYVEDFGAKGDGVTDDSLAFQNAINYASINSKTICLLNKTYALSHFTLKNNMSIISNEYAILKILESDYSSFINIDNGAITNLIYNATLKNVYSRY